jgi:uncharacterized membrane protein YcaP (DUF421 family)
MFDMSMGVGEHIFRAAIVYIFLFLLIRFFGKKHVGELSPFDLVVLLILSETVQNSMIGQDMSLVGGLVSATTLLVLAQAMSFLAWRSRRAERFIDGTPKILVRHGSRRRDTMKHEQISISELMEAMRREGLSNIADVRAAFLENDGTISIIKRKADSTA